MKFLLVAVNAKYIHSNLGVYSLKAYADHRRKERDQILKREKAGFLPSDISACRREKQQAGRPAEIEIGEYTINHQIDLILKDIYQRQPDAIGFSCYIWNIDYVLNLVKDVRKIMPRCDIWLGGPEVSYHSEEILEQEPAVSGIMRGEGEKTFAGLMEFYECCKTEPSDDRESVMDHLTRKEEAVLADLDGIVYRDSNRKIMVNPVRPAMDMSEIPFSYEDLAGFNHRIIYYESSRGCPFSCSYCLSSIDKSVRFRDLKLVREELNFFLEHKVPQVKFVDRTFNCKKSHAIAIWKHLLEHDNGVTNFHFEISADLLDEEELALIKRMRPGLIQLEIGVQTTNQKTIREIRRKMDLVKLSSVVAAINGFGNVHQHLDLIAGLPYEGYESFKNSFNDVYAMRPEQLQLGFLKVLKGSYMEEMAKCYGLIHKGSPPYEVLSTDWLDYGEILKLKAVEEMVEVYYNSGQFKMTIAMLEKEFPSPFDLYEELAKEYETRGLFLINHNRLARYEILFEFVRSRCGSGRDSGRAGHRINLEACRDSLIYDLYLRENLKSRPSFARDQSPYKSRVRNFFMREAAAPEYLTGYEGYDSRQISKMSHVEVMGDESFILFDYRNRNPWNHNAKAVKVDTI